MGKNLLSFLAFFFVSFTSFSQKVSEKIQLDTITESIEIIYKPSNNATYYFKKIAVFADDTSQIAIEKSYTSYGQNGIYKVYYPSGRLKVKTVFANNKINGEWTWYDQNGIILVKGKYRNGIKHGYWAYKSLKIYGRYKKGYKHKKWKRFDENENKYFSHYRKGILVGGEGFGNEYPVIFSKTDPTANVNYNKNNEENGVGSTEDVEKGISKEYQQVIQFLTKNAIFRKALKEHFSKGKLSVIRKLKKHFNNGRFQYVISPAMIPLGISSFVEESQEGKIVVEKIDSVLKHNPVNIKLLFFKEGLKENEELYKNSTNLISSMAVYFSEIHQNLIRIDIVKFDSTIGKNNFESRYKSSDESQKFRVLLYFNNDGILKGAEYEKP